ncbi:hypothetical protein HAX54_030208 [Datura stramonium]|uniref:Uncharacterized protein n=1 Tax=Datura stramonium TaxID=4076 RepID=A0ABS8V8R7_DATST|nr:hypothetical protein [Datura stramonium]
MPPLIILETHFDGVSLIFNQGTWCSMLERDPVARQLPYIITSRKGFIYFGLLERKRPSTTTSYEVDEQIYVVDIAPQLPNFFGDHQGVDHGKVVEGSKFATGMPLLSAFSHTRFYVAKAATNGIGGTSHLSSYSSLGRKRDWNSNKPMMDNILPQLLWGPARINVYGDNNGG